MVLTRELAHRDGYLLLAWRQRADRRHHQPVVRLEQTERHNLTVPFARRKPEPRHAFVDDEESILKSLKRILPPGLLHLRRQDSSRSRWKPTARRWKPSKPPATTTTTCSSAITACRLWTASSSSKATKEIRPDAARLILSGYADLNALVRAVNEVGIDRFIGKPWNDYDLMSAIGQALAHRRTAARNRQLASLVRVWKWATRHRRAVGAERLGGHRTRQHH